MPDEEEGALLYEADDNGQTVYEPAGEIATSSTRISQV